MEEEANLGVEIKDCYWMLFTTSGTGSSLAVLRLFLVRPAGSDGKRDTGLWLKILKKEVLLLLRMMS